jgi:predicted Zn-dependent protease
MPARRMPFLPSPPRTAVALLLSLQLALPLPLRADAIALPDLGDESRAVITPTQERKLGEDFMRRARTHLRLVDDFELNDYIQQLGQRLVARSDTPQQDFRFFVVDDPSINAFAVPGGFVGVHTGLIRHAQSESELASVLAHETAHVTQRHIPRLIAEENRTTLPALAAILASILLASSGAVSGAEAGVALTTAAVAQKGLNFTRAFEEEADRIGMQILARAEFDPRAMPQFFERMQQANRYNDTSLPEYLRTHPVTTNRIADSRNRAERFPPRTIPDSSAFHHVRAKIRAFAPGDAAEIARSFRADLESDRSADPDAERYGYALALARAQDYAAARAEIGKLLARHPRQPYYRIAQAEIEMRAGRYPEALGYYAAARRDLPDSPAIARQYAAALLKTGQPRAARDLLGPLLRQRGDDPALYRMMAAAAGDSGAPAEAHRAQAEFFYLTGNLNGAIQQLQLASRLAGDNFYLQSSIEARMSAIKEEIALYQQAK